MRALHLFHNKRHFTPKSIVLFAFPLFFILLADSIMSYLFPILVEKSLNSNSLMGIIMALSSMLGIVCDFMFPQLLRNRSWKFQLTAGIIIAFLFPIFSSLGAWFSLLFFFIIATLIWGVYFEFLQFCQQSFIVGEEASQEYSKDWGVLFLVYEITINFGPVIGSILLKNMLFTTTATVNIIQIISLLVALWVITHFPSHRKTIPESQIKKTLKVLKELQYWKILGEHVWPVVVTGVLVSFVNASYWTIGGLLGMEMAEKTGYDWLVMVLYGLPLLGGSLLLTRYNLHEKKKRFSQISLLAGGVIMCSYVFLQAYPLLVFAAIALSSFAFSFAGPLNEAVYSDLLQRSGKSRLHLLGIAKSNTSLAYIIAPLFVGILSDKVNYYTTLSMVGGLCVCVSIILLVFTPRKIKLPQSTLQKLS